MILFMKNNLLPDKVLAWPGLGYLDDLLPISLIAPREAQHAQQVVLSGHGHVLLVRTTGRRITNDLPCILDWTDWTLSLWQTQTQDRKFAKK